MTKAVRVFRIYPQCTCSVGLFELRSDEFSSLRINYINSKVVGLGDYDCFSRLFFIISRRYLSLQARQWEDVEDISV